MEHATKAAETEECEKEVNGISYEGLELLKFLENNGAYDYLFADEGIYLYYVHDGGITIGYGH